MGVHFVDDERQRRIFVFKKTPLGLIMAEDDPSIVRGFTIGSYAKEKGVGEGWRITQVASELVFAATCKPGEIERLVRVNSEGLPLWPLRMDFSNSAGETTSVYFKEGPLGMAFFNKLPLIIEDFKPGSVAQEMGVKQGWALTRVGDMDVRTETQFEKVVGYISDGIGQLPSRDNEPNGVKIG